jgi:hypothetical protein
MMRFSLLVIALNMAFIAMAQSDTVLVRSYGGPHFEQANDIIRCSAGGYAVVGTTGSNETGNTDIFLARFDDELNCIWSKNFGGSDVESGVSLIEDWSGNLLAVGTTLSSGEGSYDALVLKVSADGTFMWQQTFGGPDWDFGKKITAHPQGGFLVAVNTYNGELGGQDGLLIHIDGQGMELNHWYIGGAEKDGVHDLLVLGDGWVACGFQTVDQVMKASVWRFDLAGNEMWSRITEDTLGYNREVLAMTTDGTFLYLTGPVYASNVTHSFEQQLRLDNGVNYEVVELNSFDMEYFDCVHYNGEIVFAGSKSLSGIEIGRVTRKRNDTFFTGAFEFTGQHRTRFLNSVWSEHGLVLCGSYQPSSSQNWQAILLKYSSPYLNEVNAEPELIPCFAVGVDEEEIIETGEMGQLINLLGQPVTDEFRWGSLPQELSLSTGLYFFRSVRSGKVVKQIQID